MKITQAKTKSGKMVGVLCLDVSEVESSIEGRAYQAAALAAANGCIHWRIMDGDRVAQFGTASKPMRTSDEASKMSGPEGW